MKRAHRHLIFVVIPFIIFTGLPKAYASDIRVIDVVSVTWPSAPNFTASIDDVEKAITEEVNPRWRAFTTLEGDSRDTAIVFQFGRSLATPIVLTRALPCEGSSSRSFMESVRARAYEQLNIANYSNRYLVILSPNAGCIWSGQALVGSSKKSGGSMIIHDTASGFVITHELGHALGLGHTNFLRCNSLNPDGPWGDDCKAVEYGGTIDVMGNVPTSSTLSTYHQWRIGLLEENEIHQSWLNETVELAASDQFGGKRAIFIRDGNATYWIEYRRAHASYSAGLVIYRTDPPPLSAVVSPNSEDSNRGFGEGVGTDIWMLNWDSYRYTGSRSTGSMTLPQGRVATFFSSNVAISAIASDSSGNRVKVSIQRTPDTTPPPQPTVSGTQEWNYPTKEVIEGDYQDRDSIITGFEAKIDNTIIALKPSPKQPWSASYREPFAPPLTLQVKDLPEGSYRLQVRATDIWGNQSPWSDSRAVTIDRGDPVATNNFQIATVNKEDIELRWTGAEDLGSGLCDSSLINPEGWIVQRSQEKTAPTFRFSLGQVSTSQTRLYDCRGNGIKATLSVDAKVIAAESRRGRTGMWSPAPKKYGSGALICSGTCSMTFTARGQQRVLLGDGSADIFLGGRMMTTIPPSKSGHIRLSPTLNLGDKGAVIRVQGRNFVLVGLSNIQIQLQDLVSIRREADVTDPTLADPVQRKLALMGFREGDFAPEWTILPMARGVTLEDPTLDLCGATYRSETGREYRRQVTVTHLTSAYLFLSSEVVQYRSVALAQNALSELRSNLDVCVSAGGGQENGTFTRYQFQSLPSTDMNLVNPQERVLVHATIGQGNTARQLLALYQFSGQFFTGLYVIKEGSQTFATSEVLRWYEVAATMADRLRQL